MKISRSTLALFFGALGLTLTIFVIIVYYLHLCALPNVSIEAIGFIASTHSAAVAFFAFSLGSGSASLVIRGEKKSSWLMLISAVATLLGYAFPIVRLWVLGYLAALGETVILTAVHVTLLIFSFFLLRLR